MRVRPALAAIGAALGVLAAGCGGAVSPDDSSEHAPHFVRLSENGPAFLDYDGEPTLETSGRDWPVSLIFTGDASIAKVKSALRSVGLTRSGLTNYLAYRVGSGTLRFNADKGLKTPCDSNGTDVHVRLYAPTATDRFVDPRFGSVVVGTTHVDHGDGCSVPPTVFGSSEVAERRVAGLLGRHGWRVEVDRLNLVEQRPRHRDHRSLSSVARAPNMGSSADAAPGASLVRSICPRSEPHGGSHAAICRRTHVSRGPWVAGGRRRGRCLHDGRRAER